MILELTGTTVQCSAVAAGLPFVGVPSLADLAGAARECLEGSDGSFTIGQAKLSSPSKIDGGWPKHATPEDSMILFLDEERAYLNWVTHHRTGFVLDCLRHPTKAHLVLHRATCPEIKHSGSKQTHWTTGKHLKGCSLEIEALKTWGKDQTGHEPTDCARCTPQQAIDAEVHLTKLDRDIIEIVLEIASIHIDENDDAYSLTVGTVARCVGKTAGQLMPALARLVDDKMLVILGKATPGEILPTRCGLLPTAKALRNIPAYAVMTDDEVEAELSKLTRAD